MNNGKLFSDQLLTDTYVYSDEVPLSNDSVELHVLYDPDEGASSGRGANLIIQVADTEDPASADWHQVGEISSSSGTLTFTPRELLILTTGAGTKKYAIWKEEVQGRWFRVGIKEASVSADYGNLTVHFYANKA